MTPELRSRAILVALIMAAWAAIVYSEAYVPAAIAPKLEAIVMQLQVLLGGVVGYHVGAGNSSATDLTKYVQRAAAAPLAPLAQVGHARVPLLAFLAACAFMCLLAGCSTTTATMYASWETAAKKGIQAADDNLATTLHDALCGLPYSAIQRQPAQTQQAVQVLCGPLNTGGLDAGQIATLLQLARGGTIMLAPGAK